MRQVLERYMQEGAEVQITTVAVRNGESVGIKGRIVALGNDPHNPAVTIHWTSSRTGNSGKVTYGIPHIVRIRRWESYPENPAPTHQHPPF